MKMTELKESNNSAGVTDLIKKLNSGFIPLIEEIRKLILQADKEIDEHIKWNSPAFFYNGKMKPFNPKEYKRDIVVMNLRKNTVLLVFPTGDKIKDPQELLEGKYTDGRRLFTFKNPTDVKEKGKYLQTLIKNWLSQVEK